MAPQYSVTGDIRDSLRFVGSLSTAASIVFGGGTLTNQMERETIFIDLLELAFRISRQQEELLGDYNG